MNVYERLREKLNLFPIGLPAQPETEEMLSLLFTQEEAELAVHIPILPMMYTAGRIAAKAGADRHRAAELLEEMADKGLIIGKKFILEFRYTLLPAYPGMIELQFTHGGKLDERSQRIGDLWHKAYNGEYGREDHGYETSSVRVVPVGRSIDTTQRVFNYEEAEKIIKSSGAVAITNCACRTSAGKCSKPLDVCMLFGPVAHYISERKLAWRVTEKEAMKALAKAEDAGLVHVTFNCKAPVMIMCNCCSCCCVALRGVTTLGNPADSVASNFRSENTAPANCTLCGACVKACPFEAVAKVNERIEIAAEKCVGCGVCVHKCKFGALTMVRKTNKSPLPSFPHLVAKMYEERNKLPLFLENLPKDLF